MEGERKGGPNLEGILLGAEALWGTEAVQMGEGYRCPQN
jgi:hypothetical protein